MAFDTWVTPFHSAENQDEELDMINGPGGSSGATLVNTGAYVQTGLWCFELDYTSNPPPANGSVVTHTSVNLAHDTPGILAIQFSAGLDSAPGTNSAPIFDDRNGLAGLQISTTNRYLRVLSFGGGSPTLLKEYSDLQIPTVAKKEITVFYDGLNKSGDVWVTVFDGDVEHDAFAAGMSWADLLDNRTQNFWWGGARFADCKLYLDDMHARFSTTPGDAPHLTAYPHLRGTGGMSNVSAFQDGAYNAWTGDYTRIDDNQGAGTINHDGDTTRWNTADEGVKQSAKSNDATNPVPAGATIVRVQSSMIGRTNADKFGAFFLLKTNSGATGETQGPLACTATSHSPYHWLAMARPGGGAWVRADWDNGALEWGGTSAGTSANPQLTMFPQPIAVYYTDSLPLSTAPPAAAGTFPLVNSAPLMALVNEGHVG